MSPRFTPGQPVQTPLGKGVVLEARSSGRLLVDINGRSVVLEERTVAAIDASRKAGRRTAPAPDLSPQRGQRGAGPSREIDLHGLTVEEAIAACERALNEALLADASELRVIHGKGGGRIRAALHRRLREFSAIRAFRLDPRNEGVTIVVL